MASSLPESSSALLPEGSKVSPLPEGNTKANRLSKWWTRTQVTSDGNDNAASLQGPLLGTHDQPNRLKSWAKILILLPITLVLVACIAFALVLLLQTNRPTLEIVNSHKGVVTCDDARCSEVGVSFLRKGGNAVDAAIATALCLGVVNPTESGIGGGAFIVIHNATTSKTVAFDAREVAPDAAYEKMYEHKPDAKNKGPLSMAVPGFLAGLEETWKSHGSLPWRTLFEPSINYARNGFVVFPYLAKYIEHFEQAIMADLGKRAVLAPNGRILKRGETCYNRRLADTLERVAANGADAFYKDLVGLQFVYDVSRAGGIITEQDLRNYKVIQRDALEVDFMGYKLIGMPPPSGALVGLAMVANVLQNYGTTDALKGSLGLHRLTEAVKHMLAIRMHLGDPDFDDVADYVYNMTSSPSFAQEIWRKINDTRTFPPDYYTSRWNQSEHHGTSHIGVVDSERNAVGLTASINDHFGGKMMSRNTGILINNEMADFSIQEPGNNTPSPPANRIKPGKRPLSSMTPLILFKDGQLAGVMGGSGGMHIIAAITQVFFNHFVLGHDPLVAVQGPRIFPMLKPDDLLYENYTVFNQMHIEFPEQDIAFLASRGHKMKENIFPPVCHLIIQTFENSTDLGRKIGRSSVGAVNLGKLTAVADIRKDAKPAAM